MGRNSDKMLYVRTNYTGFIPELGTAGPVVTPMLCPIGRCVKMLSAGVKLFAVEPTTGATKELNISNIDDPDLFGAKQQAAKLKFNTDKPVTPAQPITPPTPAPVAETTIDKTASVTVETPVQSKPTTKAERKAAKAKEAAAAATTTDEK